jgi:uncharacterized protein
MPKRSGYRLVQPVGSASYFHLKLKPANRSPLVSVGGCFKLREFSDALVVPPSKFNEYLWIEAPGGFVKIRTGVAGFLFESTTGSCVAMPESLPQPLMFTHFPPMKYLFYFILSLSLSACLTKRQAMPTAPDQSHALRLLPGQDLRAGIQKFVTDNKIKAGWIVTCAGSLTDYNIRFANNPEGSRGRGHFEIVSLTGTLSQNGSHIHISLSDSTGKTIGGHLLEGCKVYTTAEIILTQSSKYLFTRKKDGSTPWEELQITELKD